MDVAIVMLTVSDHEQHLFDAIRAGVSGYLLKDVDPDRLPAGSRACCPARRRSGAGSSLA
jgi:DNA-binding NarL/FixJ family response regulator